jgi:peptide/nickel transport system substrate-binding protein
VDRIRTLPAAIPRRRGRHRRRLGLAGLLDACGQGTTTAPQSTNATLNAGIPAFTLQSGDPHLGSQSSDGWVIRDAVGDFLVRRDLNQKQVPNLAPSWTTSPDGLTWTFTLRSGVKMHDGTTMTARDFVTATNRVVKNTKFASFYGVLAAQFDSATAIDDTHFAIKTKTPISSLLDALPQPIPTDYYNQVGEAGFSAKAMSNGPFKFASLVTNQSLTLERFDDFWDKSRMPNFKTLVLNIIPDEATRLAGLQSGSLDIITALTPNAVQSIQSVKGVRIVRSETATFGELSYRLAFLSQRAEPAARRRGPPGAPARDR